MSLALLITVGLVLPLSSCGGAPASTSSPADPAPQAATEQAESADADTDAADRSGDESKSESAAAKPTEAPAGIAAELASQAGKGQGPKREPTFHFEPGGPIPDADLGKYHVSMQCAVDGVDQGTMLIEMWAEKAPITVRNFLRYCDEGFYEGKIFHRIMREFMLQGGDPTGTGGGNGPYGTIKGEFSNNPKWGHHYGVLSMARMGGQNDSASCQIFLCNAESMSVWGLDGKYASFAKLAHGVATLEALSNVPVVPGPGGEPSKPTKKVTITKVQVHAGPPTKTEKIVRPAPDLNGEPAKVQVQHVLISFKETRVAADRTKEEAAVLAKEILERAKAGEKMSVLVKEYSDDNVDPKADIPGSYTMVNRGVVDAESERAIFELNAEYKTFIDRLRADMAAGRAEQASATKELQDFQTVMRAKMNALQVTKRGGMVKGFGDIAFGLKVGEVGIANYHETESPFGWHIIKRLK